uniref:Uncharacterized protein n=1 Tax=Oryza punctata TaxID=4537 RepID=A0A0E0L7K9_ORYPU
MGLGLRRGSGRRRTPLECRLRRRRADDLASDWSRSGDHGGPAGQAEERRRLSEEPPALACSGRRANPPARSIDINLLYHLKMGAKASKSQGKVLLNTSYMACRA